jgi:hypothetical protein
MTIQECGTPDYAIMDGPTLLQAMGDNAANWAAAFRQTALKLGYSDMDEGWLIGWFANAIEHSTDVRRERSKPYTLPVAGAFPS